MNLDQMGMEEYQSILCSFESARKLVLQRHDFTLLKAYRTMLLKKIDYEKGFVKDHFELKSVGRGGNNISQNIKKCIFSLIRKLFPQHIFTEIMENCIIKYKLKSQKELVFFVFLFLLKLAKEGKLQFGSVISLIESTREKTRKFIDNSLNRMVQQPERAEFHKKNMEEFSKYLCLDLEFSRNCIIDLKDQLKGLYIKKVKEYRKAEASLMRFIASEPYLKEIFTDLSEGESQALKVQELG